VCSIQLGKVIGAKVIGVSTSEAKLGRLRDLGLDLGICARGEDFSAQALAATGGKGVDLAVDLVGGTVFGACQRSLGNFGRLAVVGYVDGVMKAEVDLEAVHGKRLEIFGISNAPLTPAMRAEATKGLNRDVMPAIIDGRIVPVIDRVFAFDELPQAKAYVEAGTQVGKVVVRLD
jgi:NADPH:quinone reductase-like Zn-dependent oxidoreductase